MRTNYCCRSAGIGNGTLYVFAPTPTPPWQVLGGVVHTECVPWHSAAQNMKPSMPGVVPAPAGATVCTKFPVVSSSEVAHRGPGAEIIAAMPRSIDLQGSRASRYSVKQETNHDGHNESKSSDSSEHPLFLPRLLPWASGSMCAPYIPERTECQYRTYRIPWSSFGTTWAIHYAVLDGKSKNRSPGCDGNQGFVFF